VSVDLLQVDNLLQHARHGVLLRAGPPPAGEPAEGGAEDGAGDDGAGDDGAGCRAFVLHAVRRGNEYERLVLQLAPLTLALEATVLARLAVIVPRSRQGQAGGGDGGESGGAHGARLLVQRLSATLEEPPDWSRRRPIYIESLLIGQIDLTISSALEVGQSHSADLLEIPLV